MSEDHGLVLMEIKHVKLGYQKAKMEVHEVVSRCGETDQVPISSTGERGFTLKGLKTPVIPSKHIRKCILQIIYKLEKRLC